MLSSFIALAAGVIGGVDIHAAPSLPIAVVSENAPRLPAEIAVPSIVSPSGSLPTPRLVKVQEDQPATQPTDSDLEVDPREVETRPLQSTEQSESVEAAPNPNESISRERRADPSVLSVTERRAVLKAASNAMSGVETAKGRFVQIDANGGLSEGEFFLQRPGRMRFDYDAPVPILIAADGVTVAMRDDELETVDRVPLVSTPLSLLLDDNLDFETEADVLRVQRANGIVAITVVDPDDNAGGELTLIFNAGSYDLLAWRVLDANGGITTVELKDVTTGISLNPRLFIVEDFEDEDDDRRR
ncbi:MAG: outer membrane lipoprotein carrier protein LolA [Pseudomonadota bacterium]